MNALNVWGIKMAQMKVLTDEGLEYLVERIDENVERLISKKVDKVDGKGLSTNDFTNEYKASVDNLVATGGQPNVIEVVNVDGSPLPVTDKTVNIDLTPYELKENVETALDGKVDKIENKGLSTNDYTNSEKSKLAGIEADADVNVIEGVQVNGSNLTVTNKKVNIDLSAYAVKSEVETALGGKVDKADGMSLMSTAEKSKIANLDDNAKSTYATKNEVSTALTGKVDKVTGSRLMTDSEGAKISKLADDPNSTYATKSELSTIPKLDKVVVDSLPTENIDEDKIYLVPNGHDGNNSRDEYLYVNGKWELIGSTQVDISGKADKTYVDAEIGEVNTRIDNLDIPDYDVVIVDELPTTGIAEDVVYLVPCNEKADKSYVDDVASDVNDLKSNIGIVETPYSYTTPSSETVVFTVPAYVDGKSTLDVYINGIKIAPTVDYTIAGNVVSLNRTLNAGQTVMFIVRTISL